MSDIAFEVIPNQVSIPIDMLAHDFRFTRKWFNVRNRSTWSTFFPDRFPIDRAYNMIQIGVFEGMDLVWCMQNIMCHPNSNVVAVDPWLATRKLSQDKMDSVRLGASHNLSPWCDKVLMLHEKSQAIEFMRNSTDLAIIDGDHRADAVYEDAVNCFRAMNTRGWMVFDDVRNRVRKKNHVQQGLDRFREEYAGRVKTIWQHRFCDCLEVVK